MPPWKSSKSGNISFKIRTNEPDGLVMYSQSGAFSRVRKNLTVIICSIFMYNITQGVLEVTDVLEAIKCIPQNKIIYLMPQDGRQSNNDGPSLQA